MRRFAATSWLLCLVVVVGSMPLPALAMIAPSASPGRLASSVPTHPCCPSRAADTHHHGGSRPCPSPSDQCRMPCCTVAAAILPASLPLVGTLVSHQIAIDRTVVAPVRPLDPLLQPPRL